MYKTSGNVATYEGAWAQLFEIGLAEMCERICGLLANPDRPVEFESRLFNSLTLAQKVTMLATVGSALLDKDEPAPKLTAIVEATTAAIFRSFLGELDFESDTNGCEEACAAEGGPPMTHCRMAVLEILRSRETEEFPLPEATDCDTGEWPVLAESLIEFICFDEDFDDENIYADKDPIASAALKAQMGIPQDYYSEVAPEPTRQELERHIATLERLTKQRLNIELVID